MSQSPTDKHGRSIVSSSDYNNYNNNNYNNNNNNNKNNNNNNDKSITFKNVLPAVHGPKPTSIPLKTPMRTYTRERVRVHNISYVYNVCEMFLFIFVHGDSTYGRRKVSG